MGAAAEGDAELSEIRARALCRRGLNRAAGGQAGAAVHDLNEAKDIWRSLGEYEAAAAAGWEAIRLSSPPPPPALLRRVEREALTVRVAAVELYQERLSGCGARPPRALADPSPEACDQLAAEAREWVAVNVVEW